MATASAAPDFTNNIDLASNLLGAKVLFATNEWFAESDNLLKPEEAVWDANKFVTYGKWMDGWESRRRRGKGHDWCIIRLGAPGVILGLDVDTAHFTGNFPPHVSVQAADLSEEPRELRELEERRAGVKASREDGHMGTSASEEELRLAEAIGSQNWDVLVPITPLGAGYAETRHNFFRLDGRKRYTHIRLNQHPDGGIARLRVYGVVNVDPRSFPAGVEVDLVSVHNGGRPLAASNTHYGHPRNMLMPGRGLHMGQGWETARQRNRPPIYELDSAGLIKLPGNDWSVIKLGVPGCVQSIEVDTNWFKGNNPESCMIEAIFKPNADDGEFTDGDGGRNAGWRPLLPRTRVGPHAIHTFTLSRNELVNSAPISHLRVTMYPDGGIMRLRVYGKPAPSSRL